MGFHTRHLSTETILAHFKRGGAKSVLNLFSADAIVTHDEFTSAVGNIIAEYSNHRDHEKLEREVKEKIETCC
jgi:hypothetical protein